MINLFNFHQDSKILLGGIDYHLLMADPGKLSFLAWFCGKCFLFVSFMVQCFNLFPRCFFFGDVSSKRDPTAYLKCIFTLYDYYRKEYCKSDSPVENEMPLVVNTHGWVKGVPLYIIYFVFFFSIPISLILHYFFTIGVISRVLMHFKIWSSSLVF